MKATLWAVCFLAINLYAQADWIPLEPDKVNSISKGNNNQQQLLPVTKLFEKVKIIHQLLDKTGATEEPSVENNKKWFIIENN